VFRPRYLLLVCLGGALSYTYNFALGDYVDGDPGWLIFATVWLPAAILLGLVVAYIAPAIAWRIRGARAAASADRERSVFGIGRSFYVWVAPFALAAVGGGLLARGDWLAGTLACLLAVLVRTLPSYVARR